jgi:hypothetical protein
MQDSIVKLDIMHLSRSWDTDLHYGSSRLFELELGLTAGVTGRQGTFSPPWHLI